MQTGARTTYILLERDSEDMALLAEINKIIAATKIKGIREFANKYPVLLELKQGLEQERANK